MSSKSHEIDLALSVMCCILEPGQTMKTKDIAEICGCSDRLIAIIQCRALKKLQGPMKDWRN